MEKKSQNPNHQYKELYRKQEDFVDAPTELLTDPAWKPGRETDVHMFLNVPGVASKEQLPGDLRNLCLALIADRFSHNIWTHVYSDESAEGGRNEIWRQRSLDQIPRCDTTSLTVPGGLQCSNCQAEILVICTDAEHLLENGKQMRIFHFH